MCTHGAYIVIPGLFQFSQEIACILMIAAFWNIRCRRNSHHWGCMERFRDFPVKELPGFLRYEKDFLLCIAWPLFTGLSYARMRFPSFSRKVDRPVQEEHIPAVLELAANTIVLCASATRELLTGVCPSTQRTIIDRLQRHENTWNELQSGHPKVAPLLQHKYGETMLALFAPLHQAENVLCPAPESPSIVA